MYGLGEIIRNVIFYCQGKWNSSSDVTAKADDVTAKNRESSVGKRIYDSFFFFFRAVSISLSTIGSFSVFRSALGRIRIYPDCRFLHRRSIWSFFICHSLDGKQMIAIILQLINFEWHKTNSIRLIKVSVRENSPCLGLEAINFRGKFVSSAAELRFAQWNVSI